MNRSFAHTMTAVAIVAASCSRDTQPPQTPTTSTPRQAADSPTSGVVTPGAQGGSALLPGTARFSKAVADLSIDSQAAYALAMKVKRPADYFSHEVVCLVGDWYVFGLPRKSGYPVGGYFVHGRTGSVERRESRQIIYREQTLEPSTWTSVEVLADGAK